MFFKKEMQILIHQRFHGILSPDLPPIEHFFLDNTSRRWFLLMFQRFFPEMSPTARNDNENDIGQCFRACYCRQDYL